MKAKFISSYFTNVFFNVYHSKYNTLDNYDHQQCFGIVNRIKNDSFYIIKSSNVNNYEYHILCFFSITQILEYPHIKDLLSERSLDGYGSQAAIILADNSHPI